MTGMEKYIIIFTNIDSLYNVSESLVSRNGIPLIEDNNFIGFNETTEGFEIVLGISNRHGVYFVKDSITQNEFNSFIGSNEKENVYILRHRLPNLNFDGFPASNVLRGAHESTGPLYDQVLSIITDAEPDKLNRLFNSLFDHDHVLESKLVLLDSVLSSNKSLTEIINIITDDKADKIKRIYAPLFTTNPELGKRIVQSKTIHNGIEVSLEDKVNKLQGEFKSLKAVDETDVFATEYQTAFDKFRDLLGVE
jgi:hypothetical protein